jgi:tetraacyldisaccharide 4'-kinase
MQPPDFWRQDGLLPALLAPLGALYALGGRLRRRAATPWRAPVRVICIGNLTVGGAGKTPTAIAVARRLAALGARPALVSRGYRGKLAGPVRVDPARHAAADVGDEPLLLAEAAPTFVARNRRAGIEAAVAAGCDVCVLDDGFQNPHVVHDLSLVVVDAGAGFGNGRVLPAGPLREPVADGLARADAVVLIGDGEVVLPPGLPVLPARLVPDEAGLRLRGRRVFAFAGIGRPEKAFATLAETGAVLAGTRAFADHHAYDEDDIARIVEDAAALAAEPVTTRKDWVRLPDSARALVGVLDVTLAFADEGAALRLLARGKGRHG